MCCPRPCGILANDAGRDFPGGLDQNDLLGGFEVRKAVQVVTDAIEAPVPQLFRHIDDRYPRFTWLAVTDRVGLLDMGKTVFTRPIQGATFQRIYIGRCVK